MELTVRILVFSGRPNPSWKIDGNTGESFFGKLQQLRAIKNSTPPVAILGYNGCIIELNNQEYMHLSNGVVYQFKNGILDNCLADDKNKLELMLMETAPVEWKSFAQDIISTIKNKAG